VEGKRREETTVSKIDYSTELMTNYVQAEIMRPETGIQALQTSSGNPLLFSIGTDNALYATVEQPGSRSGWSRCNLSAAQVAKDFPKAPGATCTNFAVAQCTDQSIHMAMVLTEAAIDHLYLCLGNSSADTSWVGHPAWVAFPYDDASHPRATLRIARVFLSEASDNEYIVVDVIRNPGSPTELIFRYYIDPTKANGTAWQPHDVSIDIEAKAYTSCLGRKAGQGEFPVDGIYTAGKVDGTAQFVYAPLYNAFDPTIPPNPDVLHLPGGVAPDAIAACRNSDNNSDLYAAAAGGLFYFASTNQENDATGVLVARNDLFNGVRNLFAFPSGANQVMVWGLNANDQIFYTTCALDKLQSPAAWSVPVPILANVEQVTPFMNRAFSANCFFAHTGESTLVKAVKSPGTLMWTFGQITLPPPTTTLPAQSFSSYTTRVQVVDEAGQPAGNAKVSLAASNVTSVYINHVYYVISATPIEVSSDALGCLTIVEGVNTVTGTRLTIGADGASVTINPMDKPFQKAAGLTTEDQLKGATIHYMNGTTKPLVAPGTATGDLQAVAAGNAKLSAAYATVAKAPPPPAAAVHAAAMAAAPSAFVPSGSILVDVGDFFAWVGHEIVSGVEHIVQFIEDTAKGLWSIVVEIAGQAYHAILDSVEAVVSAATWLFNAIKTAVKDVISFLEFLFDPADLKRTKEVIKNTAKLFLKHQADQIEVIKGEFDNLIKSAEAAVNNWAGVGSWAGLGDAATSPVNSKSTPAAGQSAPGALLSHHYQGNASNWSWKTAVQEVTTGSGPIAALIKAIENEGVAIGTTISRLQALADNFTRMPLGDALRQLLAIVVDLGLASVKNVVDALFDVFSWLVETAIELLDTPIHIPVLSDILNEFGIPDFSFLDIACWIASVPANLLYKAIHGVTPFPDDAHTTFLINTKDYATLLAAFQGPAPQPLHAAISSAAVASDAARRAPMMMMAASTPSGPTPTDPGIHVSVDISIPEPTARAVFITGQCVSGFLCLILAVVSGLEAAEDDGDNDFVIPSAVLGILAGVTNGLACVLVPYAPVENVAVADVSKAVTALRILFKICFSGPFQKGIKAQDSVKIQGLAVEDGRGVGAIVDAVLALPALFVSIWHFWELGQQSAGDTRSVSIVNEVSNVTSYLARIFYAVAVRTEGVPKAVFVGLHVAANVCNGGLLLGDASIFNPQQPSPTAWRR
jgi:hypothetical protein